MNFVKTLLFVCSIGTTQIFSIPTEEYTPEKESDRDFTKRLKNAKESINSFAKDYVGEQLDKYVSTVGYIYVDVTCGKKDNDVIVKSKKIDKRIEPINHTELMYFGFCLNIKPETENDTISLILYSNAYEDFLKKEGVPILYDRLYVHTSGNVMNLGYLFDFCSKGLKDLYLTDRQLNVLRKSENEVLVKMEHYNKIKDFFKVTSGRNLGDIEIELNKARSDLSGHLKLKIDCEKIYNQYDYNCKQIETKKGMLKNGLESMAVAKGKKLKKKQQEEIESVNKLISYYAEQLEKEKGRRQEYQSYKDEIVQLISELKSKVEELNEEYEFVKNYSELQLIEREKSKRIVREGKFIKLKESEVISILEKIIGLKIHVIDHTNIYKASDDVRYFC